MFSCIRSAERMFYTFVLHIGFTNMCLYYRPAGRRGDQGGTEDG